MPSSGTSADQLTRRALNRATLARQLLLDRAASTAGQAITHLAGLQSQAPLAPYVGLWTRLAGFRPDHLDHLMTERAAIRAHLMRNTVHLVSARDYISFRPLFQLRIERALAGNFARRLAGADLAEIGQVAAPLLAECALTRPELGQALAVHWPGHDPEALAYAATHVLALVQAPPRGLWGQGGPAAFTLASSWLDGQDLRPAAPAEAAEQLVLRYPEYDNLLLSFADRSRVIPHQRRVPLPPGNGATTGTLLLDGEWQGDWKITRDGDQAVLTIRPYTRIQAADRAGITEEGSHLLRFAASASTSHDVRFSPLVRAN